MTDKDKILIVDDNPNNLYSFQVVLKGPEFELLTALSGAQALQLLLDYPDILAVVLDVQMPGMDGFETAELIRAYPKFQDIPILFVTAVYRSDEFVRRGFRAGCSDYITKPVDNEILKSKVNVFVTLQQQKRQLAREVEARSKAEVQVRRLNTVLQAMLDVNQLIVREKDRARLVQEACERLIESHGFDSAAIVLCDGEGQAALTAQAGPQCALAPVMQGLAGGQLASYLEQALQQPGPVALELARAGGDEHAGMAARLEHDGRVYGLLCVSYPAGVVAGDLEQALLADVAADLAFALYSIEQEEARRQAEEALVQAERLSAMGRVASSLAHEINNPLQAVLGSLELTREMLEESTEMSRYIDVAVNELRRAARIIQQMRDLGRHSEGQREPACVDDLLETVVALTHHRASIQNVQILVEGDAVLPRVPIVADRIQQVFLNLVLNAIDAMPHGGELRIHRAQTQEPAGVQLSFTDSGVGIAAEDLDLAFEAFHTTKELGLGLGLYISRNIVCDHGGWIQVRSEVGQGTTLSVWLPGGQP